MTKKLNKYDAQHQRNLFNIQQSVDDIYAEAAKEAARIGVSLSNFNADRLFSFADYPSIQRKVNALLAGLKSRLTTAIVNGVRSSWTLANNKNDELCRYVFGDNIGKLSKEQYRRYFNNNEDALKAFIERKTAGLNLSDRVWRYTDQFQREIELGLDCGLRQSMSADQMSRQLRMFLRYPDKLFRRVKDGVDSDGNPVYRLSKAAADFHPGRGVYRSSYKNARRLAATETNIAYRTSDHTRWQQLDFVVGQLIEPSNTNHPVKDICDELKGRYPKDFKFTGWHPHCRCHAISILKTMDEIKEDNRRILRGEEPTQGSVNQVGDVPKKFTDWVKTNDDRIFFANYMPYFITDNLNFPGLQLRRTLPNDGSKVKDIILSSSNQSVTDYPETSLTDSLKQLEKIKIEKVPVKMLNRTLTDEEIITKVGGKDTTTGSCTSLAFAYAGNKLGFDVTDFRGGKSCFKFQSVSFVDMILKEAGGKVVSGDNTIQLAKDLFKTMKDGEDYIFASTAHTAIVRKNKFHIEFLEIQRNKEKNGFIQIYEEDLIRRFKCSEKSNNKTKKTCGIISVEQLRKCRGFRGLLEYINTNQYDT